MPNINEQDIQAMQRTAEGDEEAFCDIIHRHQNALLNFFCRMGASRSSAEDLAQETFLRLYKWRKRYKPSAKFTTFLYTLARHAWADHLRKVMRSPKTVGESAAEDAVHPESGSMTADQHMDIQAALGKLSEKLRSVVVLNVYRGLAYKEIGKILEIPEGTVKSRMFLALRELRTHLQESEEKDS